jgi:hypothetical protein
MTAALVPEPTAATLIALLTITVVCNGKSHWCRKNRLLNSSLFDHTTSGPNDTDVKLGVMS